MIRFVSLALVLAVELGVTEAVASARTDIPIPEAQQILSKVRKDHPRLLATAESFDQLKKRVASQSQPRIWHERLRGEAEKLLGEPASKYEIPDGLRLLSVSRRVLYRTQLLALMHRLDSDIRWRDRAWKELDAAAHFQDWNPRHFLDTAEMTHAFAIGYDWLFDAWTPEQRKSLRTAMVEKGIRLALKIYQERRWWATARHNWNQVCNGGIGMGALALADEQPELCGAVLHEALRSIQLPMAEFAPDGAWAEGPGYWNYATTYNVAFLAALETAIGTDFGLSQIPGFSEAGTFPIYLTGPLNRTFNYADGSDGAIRAPHLFWLARKFDRLAYARYQQRLASPHPLDLLWFEDQLVRDDQQPLPLDRHFRGADIVTFRSAWDDRDSLFVGFKAGDNKANHSHLDLGSFVFDALGKRWAIDLGADNYNLPGFFGKQRWTYYRLRAEGQNALVLNPGMGPDQSPAAAARIERFQSNKDGGFAIADLSTAYTKDASSVRRGLALVDRKRLLVQDEIRASEVDVWWFMHTPAEIELSADGRVATLKQDGVMLRAELLEPVASRFEILAAAPLATSPQSEAQNRNEGIRKLAIHTRGSGQLRVAVLMTPIRKGSELSGPPKMRPLSEW